MLKPKPTTRLWGVINYRGEIMPTSMAIHRKNAIDRFLNHEVYGYGRSWKEARRQDYRLVRVEVRPLISAATLRLQCQVMSKQIARLHAKLLKGPGPHPLIH